MAIYIYIYIYIYKDFRSRKNILRNPSQITDKPTKENFHDQLDIKFEYFTEDELETVLKTIKSRKAACLDEILPEV